MTVHVKPSDLELAALISSKICHDALNPVGAISHGLQMLESDHDADSQKFALDMIRNVTAQASARLEFARIAYGATGSVSAPIDLAIAGEVATRYVAPQPAPAKNKHRLNWRLPAGYMQKDKAKLLLSIICLAAGKALPRGGEIDAGMDGSIDRPSFVVRCRGNAARIPEHLSDCLADAEIVVDGFSIQSYYIARLARGAGMSLSVGLDGPDVVFVARPQDA
jgi:histidine phosphotransferase ChpT